MPINKAQGQTLNAAGIDLSFQSFLHGQLYVTLSRATSKQNLFGLTPGGKAINAVYKGIS